MTTKSRLFSLDDESNGYIESIPKQNRSQVVREGLKLPDRYAGYSQHSYYTQNLSGKYLTAAKILKFRDDAWMKYHTNSNYLSLIKNKFGEEAFNQTVESTKIKLKRKILGDNC